MARPPIKSRTVTLWERVRQLGFNILFFSTALTIHCTQVSCRVLQFACLGLFRPFFDSLQVACKTVFSALLVTCIAVFGKSKFVISAAEGVDLQSLVVRNSYGQIESLLWAKKSVIIANHQSYADWVYLWLVLYRAGAVSGLVIMIMEKLKWAPIVGPSMQLFRFIFVGKKNPLVEKSGVQRAIDQFTKPGDNFALLLFPEGALVGAKNRPKSKAYADKLGVPDMNCLLYPKSRGLLHSLRTALNSFPDLVVYDLTVGYSGVPPGAYPQEYFTLQSIFGWGHAPEAIHIHVDKIPLSSLTAVLGTDIIPGAHRNPLELEAALTDSDRVRFEAWLVDKWRRKDSLIEDFYETGHFRPKEDLLEYTIKFGPLDYIYMSGVCVFAVIALAVAKYAAAYIFG